MSSFCLFTSKTVIKTYVSKPNLISLFKKHSPNVCTTNRHSTLSPSAKPPSSLMDVDAQQLRTARAELLQIFDTGVSSVMPAALINEKLKLIGNDLVIDGKPHAITDNVHVVGFGKAVAGMAYALEKLLGERLKRGIISVPRASLKCDDIATEGFEGLKERRELHLQNLQMLMRSRVIEYREGAENNQPDSAALANTDMIVELAEGLEEKDTLIVLVSGGGSALLFRPKSPLTADRKRELCKKLQNAGASITELNCVRKRFSSVKGGGLAKIAYPAKVLALVLSDIVGDPLESIASGPTCPNAGEYCQNEAVDVLKKYNLYDSLEEDVKLMVSEDETKFLTDKGMTEEGKFMHVENMIIGNNATALQAAQKATKLFDLESVILTSTVEGNVKDISYAYAKLTRTACHALEKKFSSEHEFVAEILKQNVEILNITEEKLKDTFKILIKLGKGKSVLLLAGGEPTVVVEGNGKGGRNQELALRFSLDWLSEMAKDPVLAKYFVLFLSAGTDGQDGPTDAAGAFGHPAFRPKLMKIQKDIMEKKKVTLIPEELRVMEMKLKLIENTLPENILKQNDSYHFFSRFEHGKNLVKTGLTGTNVMDLHFIYIKQRDCKCDIEELLKSNDELTENCDFLFDN